eukprot:GFUD01052101.1.p1 GENE.GFUD01052101.1~~GFUD01052101.1.p1  ORF type:complete len:438 (+),score=109.97 GFUD01052101.1:63-1376(+)
MNPYYHNWNYGYTLGAPTEASRGAYTVYSPHGGANPANLATPSTTPHTHSTTQIKTEPRASWAEVKGVQPTSPPKAQVFVTATVKTEPTSSTASFTASTTDWRPNIPTIGPNKPQAIVNPTQFQGDQTAVALTKLHELALGNKLVERYEKVEEAAASGSPNANFKVNLFLGTETYQGQGSNIKAAKQQAAVQALANTKYQTINEKKYSLSTIGSRRIGVTATSELHELATKKGVRVDFKFLEPFNFEFKHSMRMWNKKEMLGNYRVQLNVAGYEFYGQAELPQQAKHNAATQAMPIVRNLPDPAGTAAVVTSPAAEAGGVTGGMEAVGAVVSCGPTSSLLQKNVNMALNEIAMMNGCVPEWTLISEAGPPHQKLFTWQLSLGQYTTTGTGPNKKIARNTAAEQMMTTLPEDWKQVEIGWAWRVSNISNISISNISAY